ncbi:hypothetical protein QFC22_005390 [Naganishia vaughanmartiniae]|uniref:Uncharacterized protein n=1 Tax=Naganishia vaughanmartiniae TaxID=1424756 RepID=A0ACC2WVJ0_9TREE|nr:hypothetical protein QFC22_005390 [Naganishia vaughanmartiniae]
MSSSMIGNIAIPSLSRFGPPPSEATTSRPAEDIALKYLKHPDANAMAVEAQEDPAYSASAEAVGRDPLELRGKILDDGQLNEIRQRKKSGKIAQFYEEQNDHIERLLKPMHVLTSEAQAEEKDAAGAVRLAIRLSFLANILLAGLQLYAAISSLSLSLFATCIDAVFDPFANILLNILHKRAKTVDEKKWPIGGSRFESSESDYSGVSESGLGIYLFATKYGELISGNIVYGGLMGMVNMILIVESIRTAVTHKDGDTNKLYIPALVSVGVAFR